MRTPINQEPVMRMSFELERGDNPPLFDELMKFTKGAKRVNRLRTLAHEGLLAQRGWIALADKAEQRLEMGEGHSEKSDDVLVAASQELFGPAVDA